MKMQARRRSSTRRPDPNTLFITVNPVGSKFAKALQASIKSKVDHSVVRVGVAKPGRKNFIVTQRVLNKVEQLRQFVAAGVSCPKWSTDPNAVTRTDLGRVVFARTLINSTNGRGILEIDLDDAHDVIPHAPLYTQYIPKKAEYRVHVFNGEVIDTQQKKKKRGFDDERNTRVRNVDNGYVYCRDGINPPDGLATLAINAVNACNYQYGAVDIIYNEKQDKCFVLEVNSRPGLMGTTLDKYSDAIIKAFNL
jgi:hypothetical protein